MVDALSQPPLTFGESPLDWACELRADATRPLEGNSSKCKWPLAESFFSSPAKTLATLHPGQRSAWRRLGPMGLFPLDAQPSRQLIDYASDAPNPLSAICAS